jgi:hypothetical protein
MVESWVTAGDERGGDRAHAGNQHTQFAVSGRDTNVILRRHDATLLGGKKVFDIIAISCEIV